MIHGIQIFSNGNEIYSSTVPLGDGPANSFVSDYKFTMTSLENCRPVVVEMILWILTIWRCSDEPFSSRLFFHATNKHITLRSEEMSGFQIFKYDS